MTKAVRKSAWTTLNYVYLCTSEITCIFVRITNKCMHAKDPAWIDDANSVLQLSVYNLTAIKHLLRRERPFVLAAHHLLPNKQTPL